MHAAPSGAQLSLPMSMRAHMHMHKHASVHTYSGAQPHSWGPASCAPTRLAQLLMMRGRNATAAVHAASPVFHLPSGGPALGSVAPGLCHLPQPSQPSLCRPTLPDPSFPHSLQGFRCPLVKIATQRTWTPGGLGACSGPWRLGSEPEFESRAPDSRSSAHPFA